MEKAATERAERTARGLMPSELQMLAEILALLKSNAAEQFKWPEEGARHILGAALSSGESLGPGRTEHLYARSEVPDRVRVLGIIPVGPPELELRDVRIGKQSVFANANPIRFGSLAPLGGVFPIEGPHLHVSQDMCIEVTNPLGFSVEVSASVLCVTEGRPPWAARL